MCLGAYGVVIDIKGDVAVVDFGGVRKEVLVATDGVTVGSYVVVHAGVVIAMMDEAAFEESMRELERLASEVEKEVGSNQELKGLLGGGADG